MTFEKDKKYRVIKEGASISGWKPIDAWSFTGWTKPLPVGTVVTCLGHIQGSGGDNIPILNWGDEKGNRFCIDAEMRPKPPNSSMWVTSPDPSYLELV